MSYYKLDGTRVDLKVRAELAVEHGLMSQEKADGFFKDKDGQQKLIEQTNQLVYDLWGKRQLNMSTHVPYSPPPSKKPDPAIIEWFKSRRIDIPS